MKDEQPRPDATQPAPRRRPYRKPTLTEYGSIAKLTQGTQTRQGDFGTGGGFKMAG